MKIENERNPDEDATPASTGTIPDPSNNTNDDDDEEVTDDDVKEAVKDYQTENEDGPDTDKNFDAAKDRVDKDSKADDAKEDK